ncbi:ATP-binding protein [Kineococcus arenarius]|uniref:ATP-binding protein n=1 Tax=Kineococcus sp. SYSU DK007 TaxID=3383128 RepID=UPI003D7E1BEB
MEQVVLPPRLSSVPAARHWVARTHASLTAKGCCPTGVEVTVLELLTTEAVANAVLHGGGEVVVQLSCTGEAVRVAVSDAGAAMPVVRRAGPEVVGGHGVALIDTLAGRWGVDAGSGAGKTVWFELSARG